MEQVIPSFVLTKQKRYNDVRSFQVTSAASAKKFSVLKQVIHVFSITYRKFITYVAFITECNAEPNILPVD